MRIKDKFKILLIGWSMLMLSADPAFALDTTRTYNSGILVGLFLGFCALVIVVQLVPTILMLINFVRKVVKGAERQTHRDGYMG